MLDMIPLTNPKDKMTPLPYQDLRPEDVPKIERADGTRIRIRAGECEGVRGAVSGIATPIPFTLTLLFPHTRLLNSRSRQAIRRAVIS